MYLTPVQKKLVLDNKRLAYYLANKYRSFTKSKKIDIEDLEQIALCALCKASLKYHPDKGYAFSTYAATAIKNALLIEIPKYISALHYPQHILRPESTGVAPKAIELFNSGYGHTVDITSIVDLPDTKNIAIDDYLDRKLFLGNIIRRLVNQLTPSRRYAISSYLGLDIEKPMSVSEISILYNISEKAVRNRIYLAKKQFRKLIGQQIDFYV